MFRHSVRPGITGWAQINGFRGNTSNLEQMKKRVEFDAWYIENYSLYTDLKIVFRTVLLIFQGDKNAY
jgi:lipopolysaccharide/colanic/teichoic acid biosynthesis glycosyltransferase